MFLALFFLLGNDLTTHIHVMFSHIASIVHVVITEQPYQPCVFECMFKVYKATANTFGEKQYARQSFYFIKHVMFILYLHLSKL